MRLIAFLVALLIGCAAFAQSAPILVNGRFDDWVLPGQGIVDANSPSSGIDITGLDVRNDDERLFLRISFVQEIDLQDDLVPQTVRLYIDADNDASTGLAVQTGYGAELQIRFDTRTVTQYVPSAVNVGWASIGLVPLPTVTSDTFEMAINRSAVPDGVHPLFSSSTIKVLLKDTDGNDVLPEVGSVFSYTFDTAPVVPYQSVPLERIDPSHVRMMAWNVLGDGIISGPLQDEYQRILQSIAPDVIGFSECVSSTAAQVKMRLDTWLPIGGTGWHTLKDDFDMIVASRWPITGSWPALSRQFPVLIDLPSSYATDLLFTAAHLNCCTADATRQQQVDAWAQFVLDAKLPGGVLALGANTPVVYAGDLNLVGYAQQLTTLMTGAIVNTGTYGNGGPLDWDGTTLTDALMPQSDERSAFTWANTAGSYPPGRLDYLLYSDAVMQMQRCFALRTATMSAARLAQCGLNAGDTDAASDHLPVVADFALAMVAPSVLLAPKVMLEGPFDSATGLMNDALRSLADFPLIEPYSAMGLPNYAGSGGEAMHGSLLSLAGNDAVVDWIRMELRSASDPTSVLAARHALVQRDGDVVSASDGLSPISFNLPAGNYFVAVRHRNHLGTMTATTLSLNAIPAVVDFRNAATLTYGTSARTSSGAVQLLWAGNSLMDGVNSSQLKYTGTGNDRDPILVAIGGTVPTNTVSGYYNTDVNLDGTVKYTGTANDRDPILVNVGGTVPTAIRVEQLP